MPDDVPRSARLALVLLGLLLAYHVVQNGLYIHLSPFPRPIHNVHSHLEMLDDTLRLGASGTHSRWELFTSGRYDPPLLHLFTAFLIDGLGRHWRLIYVAGTLSLLVLGWGTWLIGCLLFDRETALLSTVLATSAPIVVGFSRSFDTPLPSAALTTLALGLALASDGFRRPWTTLASFAAAAAALLTNRVVPAAYLAGPFLLVVWTGWRRLSTRGLTSGVLLLLITTGPFYLSWMERFLGTDLGWHRMTADASSSQLLQLRAWLYYLAALPDSLIHLPWTLALVPSVPMLLYAPRRSAGFVVLWVLPALLLFSAIPKKDPVYILPAVPGLAILASWGLLSLARESGRLPRFRRSLPVLLAGLVLLDVTLTTWTPYQNVMEGKVLDKFFPVRGTGADETGAVIPADWVGPPVGGQAEIEALEGAMVRAARASGPGLAPRIGIFVPHMEVLPPEMFSSRLTILYYLRFHRPDLEVYSTEWPHHFRRIIDDFQDLDFILRVAGARTPPWPDERELEVYRQHCLREDPHGTGLNEPGRAEEARDAILAVARSGEDWQVLFQSDPGRGGMTIRLYKRRSHPSLEARVKP